MGSGREIKAAIGKAKTLDLGVLPIAAEKVQIEARIMNLKAERPQLAKRAS